jgi:hypothetical protein
LAPALLLFMVSVRCSLFFSGLRIWKTLHY